MAEKDSLAMDNRVTTTYLKPANTPPPQSPSTPTKSGTPSSIDGRTARSPMETKEFLQNNKPFSNLQNKETVKLLAEVLTGNAKEVEVPGFGMVSASRLTQGNTVYVVLEIGGEKYAFTPRVAKNNTVTALDFAFQVKDPNKKDFSDTFNRSDENKEVVATPSQNKVENPKNPAFDISSQKAKDIKLFNSVTKEQLEKLYARIYSEIKVSLPYFGDITLYSSIDEEVYFFDKDQNTHYFNSKTGEFIKSEENPKALDLTTPPLNKSNPPTTPSCDTSEKPKESETTPSLNLKNLKLANIQLEVRQKSEVNLINLFNYLTAEQLDQLVEGKLKDITVSIPPFEAVTLYFSTDDKLVYFYDNFDPYSNNSDTHYFNPKTGAFIKTDRGETEPEIYPEKKKESNSLDLTSKTPAPSPLQSFLGSVTNSIKSFVS